MECQVGDVAVHYVEHGAGTPVLVLHGAGVDHREVEACFEPALGARDGHRRIYPDLPGMGRTTTPLALGSADDVLQTLLGFVDRVVGDDPLLVIGHSAGGYFAQGLAAWRPHQVAGLALVCPLLPQTRDVPEHQPVIAADGLGDEEFRNYFVVQTPEMLVRYQRFVAPAIPLADTGAMERIGSRWELSTPDRAPFGGAVLVVVGRQDATVGYAAAMDLVQQLPRATLAVLDGAGHALPHEQPDLLAALVGEWLGRAAPGTPRR